MLAHELRNPLAPIRTAVQLLRLKELPEAHSARARDIIDRQVEHLVTPDRRPARRVAHHARHDHAAARAGAGERDRRRAIEISAAGDRRRAARAGPRARRRAADDRGRSRRAWCRSSATSCTTPPSSWTPAAASSCAWPREGGASRVHASRTTGIGIPADASAAVFDLFTQVHGDRGRRPGRPRHRPGARPAAGRDARRHRVAPAARAPAAAPRSASACR